MSTEWDKFESNKENVDPEFELSEKLFKLDLTPNSPGVMCQQYYSIPITNSTKNSRVCLKRPLEQEDGGSNINDTSKYLRNFNKRSVVGANAENQKP